MLEMCSIKTENELIFRVKNGLPSMSKGLHCTLWNHRVLVGNILTSYSPGDLIRATKVAPENEIVIARLVRAHVHLGMSGMKFLILHPDRGDAGVLVGWIVARGV